MWTLSIKTKQNIWWWAVRCKRFTVKHFGVEGTLVMLIKKMERSKKEGKLNEAKKKKSGAKIKTGLKAKVKRGSCESENLLQDTHWISFLKWPQWGWMVWRKLPQYRLAHWMPHRKLKLCLVINLSVLLTLPHLLCALYCSSLGWQDPLVMQV